MTDSMTPAELPRGARIMTRSVPRRGGVLVRYEDGRARTRWAVVLWDNRQFTEQVEPSSIEPLAPQ